MNLTVGVIMERAVSGGTLDAIRERMKSMQIAAAGGNADSGSRTDGENHHPGLDNPVHPMDEKALSGLQARMERLKSGTLEHL